jgi:hypothetical protein
MHMYRVGNLIPAVGARNQVGIGLSYRPASLCSLATQFQTRILESIPRPIAELEFLKSLWGLGTEEEEGYRTGPPAARLHRLAEFIPWNRFRGPIHV